MRWRRRSDDGGGDQQTTEEKEKKVFKCTFLQFFLLLLRENHVVLLTFVPVPLDGVVDVQMKAVHVPKVTCDEREREITSHIVVIREWTMRGEEENFLDVRRPMSYSKSAVGAQQ